MSVNDQLYVVWSLEHQAWWKASRFGYAETLADAGRFSYAEAADIVRKANVVRLEECMIPVSALMF